MKQKSQKKPWVMAFLDQWLPTFSCIRIIWGLWVCVCALRSVLLFQPHGLPTRLLCPWDFPGKNTGIGFYFLLEWLFLTQGLNPCLICPVLAGGFFTTSATSGKSQNHLEGLLKKISGPLEFLILQVCNAEEFALFLRFTNAAKRPHFQNLS